MSTPPPNNPGGQFSAPDPQSGFAAVPRPQQSDKDFVVAWLLALFLGGLGVDRFYRGFIGLGLLKLVTCGGAGVWSLIDLLIILVTGGKDAKGLPLAHHEKHAKLAWIVTAVVIAAGVVFGSISAALSPDEPSVVSPDSAPTAPLVDGADDQANAADAAEDADAPAADEQDDQAAAADEKKADAAEGKADTTTSAPADTEESEPADEKADDSTSDSTKADDEKPDDNTSEEKDAKADPRPADSDADVPREYISALKSAQVYSDMMHMSKKGIYDQLTSEYGDAFTPEAAQYAIDHLDADWNANALASAKVYQDEMNMSPAAIHDQLTSEYGEQFTEEQADYAIEHLNE